MVKLKNPQGGRENRIYWFDKLVTPDNLFESFLPTLKQIQSDIDQIAKEREFLKPEQLSLKENKLDQLTIEQYLKNLNAPPLFMRLADATQFTEYGARINKLNALLLHELISIDLENKYFVMDGNLGDEGQKIEGGNSLLTDKLAKELTYPINFSHKLLEISFKQENNTYKLLFENDTHHKLIEADYVIVALPNPVLKNDIKMDHKTLLTPKISRVINELGYGNVTKFIMKFSQAPWRKNTSDLAEIMSDNYDIWDSSFHEKGNKLFHLTIYMGEPQSLKNMEDSADLFAKKVLEHLERLYPDIHKFYLGYEPSIHWPSNPLFQGAFSGVLLPGQWHMRRFMQSPGVHNLALAGEQWSFEHAGFMEGALESGQWAADYIGKKVLAYQNN